MMTMQRYSPLARPQAVLSSPTGSACLARCSSCVGGAGLLRVWFCVGQFQGRSLIRTELNLTKHINSTYCRRVILALAAVDSQAGV